MNAFPILFIRRRSKLFWVAAGLFALAAALRLVALDRFPPGVQHDEVFVANFAQTILQGQYPIFFELNRGNEPLFMYLVAGMFRVFGENAVALRATAAICGIGGLVLTFLLSRELFTVLDKSNGERVGGVGNWNSGQFIAFVTLGGITFSFWHLYESRIGLHTVSTYLFAAATFYAYWRGWTRGSSHWLIASGVLAGLATYTYRSGIFVPLTLVVFGAYSLVFHRKVWGRRWWLALVVVGIAAAIYFPLGYYVYTHPGTALARLGDLSGDIDALRQGDPVPLFLNVARVLGMFGASGDQEWRYNVAGRPVFDPLWAALFYAGVLLSITRVRRAAYAFALCWLGVMLLPSILSGSDLSQHRAVGAIGAVFMMPALTLDAARVWTIARWGKAGVWTFGAVTATLIVLSALGGLGAYFVTWTQNPEVRLIHRADLAEAARWLDEHQIDERALVSAEFANDLDRGSFNLLARRPNRAQFFQGRDTFVLPARADAYIVSPRSGPLDAQLRDELLADPPVYQSKLANGQLELEIFRLDEEELQVLRTVRGLNAAARSQDGQITIIDAVVPETAQTGDQVRAQLWWQIGGPQVTDASGLEWIGTLTDESGYPWSEAATLGYTPSQWQRDDIVISLLPLEVPVDAPPGTYEFRAGLSSSGGALALAKQDQEPGVSVALGEIRIERGAVPQTKPDLPVRYPSKAKFGDVLLLGSDAVGQAAAGSSWRLVLFWSAEKKLPSNYKLLITAETEDGTVFLRDEETLLRGRYPTRQWRAGDFVRSVHDIEIPLDAPRGRAIVRVLLRMPDGRPVGRADGAPIAGIEITGRTPSFEPLEPLVRRTAQMGDFAELIGYDLSSTVLRAGEPMAVTLYWRAVKASDKPYTVFVHLLDESGIVIGQSDAMPLRGDAPTDKWQSGEYIADTFEFNVSPSAKAGSASLEIGMYDVVTGQRLLVREENGAISGDRMLVSGLELVE